MRCSWSVAVSATVAVFRCAVAPVARWRKSGVGRSSPVGLQRGLARRVGPRQRIHTLRHAPGKHFRRPSDRTCTFWIGRHCDRWQSTDVAVSCRQLPCIVDLLIGRSGLASAMGTTCLHLLQWAPRISSNMPSGASRYVPWWGADVVAWLLVSCTRHCRHAVVGKRAPLSKYCAHDTPRTCYPSRSWSAK